MSNDVTLFAAGMQNLPAHLQGVEIDEATRKLAGGGGGLRISIKGGVWRMLNDGEEIQRNEDRALNVVVVASSPDTARTYYEGKWVEGESSPPVCWSLNGVAPEPTSPKPQSTKCVTCPQNIAGSGDGDSRACRYSRSLAVTLENDVAGKVFKIQLPAQSLFGKIENGVAPLQAYGKQLVAHNTPISAVVTEMRFDTTSATPKLGFKAVRYLTADEYATAKVQGQSPEAIEATKTTAYEQDNGTNAPLAIPGTSPVVVETPATVAVPAGQSQPVTRRRAPKVDTPAAAPTPAEIPDVVDASASGGQSIEQMMKQMQDMQAALQKAQRTMAAKPAPAAQEPVVVQSQKSAAPLPASTAAMLASWEDGDDE